MSSEFLDGTRMTQITRILFFTFFTTEYTEFHRVLFKFPFVIQTTGGRKDDKSGDGRQDDNGRIFIGRSTLRPYYPYEGWKKYKIRGHPSYLCHLRAIHHPHGSAKRNFASRKALLSAR